MQMVSDTFEFTNTVSVSSRANSLCEKKEDKSEQDMSMATQYWKSHGYSVLILDMIQRG